MWLPIARVFLYQALAFGSSGVLYIFLNRAPALVAAADVVVVQHCVPQSVLQSTATRGNGGKSTRPTRNAAATASRSA